MLFFTFWALIEAMFILAIILFLLWIGGFLVFHIAGLLIHLLLIAAVVVVLLRIIQGRPPIS